jgi:hypothetical protein
LKSRNKAGEIGRVSAVGGARKSPLPAHPTSHQPFRISTEISCSALIVTGKSYHSFCAFSVMPLQSVPFQKDSSRGLRHDRVAKNGPLERNFIRGWDFLFLFLFCNLFKSNEILPRNVLVLSSCFCQHQVSPKSPTSRGFVGTSSSQP